MSSFHLGIDVGSVSVKTILLDEDNIVFEDYTRVQDQPARVLLAALEKISRRFDPRSIAGVAVTGTGGHTIADLLGGACLNEIVAQAAAAAQLHPQARTIIDIGGEDSKLICLEHNRQLNTTVIADFAMNTICAAGTGSFLDQQANRLGVNIENEFGDLALKSENPPRIAGRCSVFAKTDMIHLQQEGTPDYDIIAGLCFALVRTFRSVIARGKPLRTPIYFHGGVAANQGIVRAFREVLALGEEDFIVPPRHALMGALGAAFEARNRGAGATAGAGLTLERLRDYVAAPPGTRHRLDPLEAPEPAPAPAPAPAGGDAGGDSSPREGFLGIDVGSISTNVVVINREGALLARRYLPTAGRPIEAVRQGIREIGAELGNTVAIRGVGTTGSGRYLIGDFVGADTVKNEITAQATAAAHIDPTVDTIFEIGGQDSKYIALDGGVIVDFEMNKVCAAGTGSFLEEQAERLGVPIRDRFAELAFGSGGPVPLGERCTVFMETELVHHQQTMAPREDLAAGLAYSIVQNYLNRVVARRRIGNNIFFQGAVALNRAVVAAFEKSLGRPVTVPPNNDVTGAIGAALLAAREATPGTASRFKGWARVVDTRYQLTSFECADCANRCEIRQVTVDGGHPFYYGSRCEKFNLDRPRKSATDNTPNLFAEREKLLFRQWLPPLAPARGRIGLPRALIFYELFPFWKAFFESLGFTVVLSDRTNKEIIRQGIDSVAAETCFPVKVAHGHIANLLDKDVDYLFLPMVVNMKQPNQALEQAYNCPYVQTLPFMAKSAFDFSQSSARLLTPVIPLGWGEKIAHRSLLDLAPQLNRSRRRVAAAINRAWRAQSLFQQAIQERGRAVMAGLEDSGRVPIVIVSRPYNGCDPGINLNLPRKLIELGALPVPLDFLPLESVDVAARWSTMYWRYGQKILAAAEIISRDRRLECLYITNFGCGPDSFIGQFFKDRLRDKPYLEIEIDEHSADVGAITRCEAFLDSIGHRRGRAEAGKTDRQPPSPAAAGPALSERIIYIPDMGDAALAMQAALEGAGIEARVFPRSNEETLTLGRRYTCGKECYPCIITTGDMLRVTRAPDFDPRRTVFFMPAAMGPCRFGQYNQLQRIILDENGLAGVPIISPNQINNLEGEMKIFGRRVFRAAWQGIVAIDALGRLAREIRPYEQEPGATDRAYRDGCGLVTAAIRAGRPAAPAVAAATRLLQAIPVSGAGSRPVISIVGEIFVRLNEFSNNHLVRRIEALGGEVWLAPTSEWFLHVNRSLALYQGLRGRRRQHLVTRLAGLVQQYDEKTVTRPVTRCLRHPHEPTVAECWNETEPYLPGWYGEAALSIGKSVDSWRQGAAGIINVMPFTCLPGNIAAAVFKRFREDHDNIPCLNLAYDGLEQVNESLQLEAFMHQARQYRDARRR